MVKPRMGRRKTYTDYLQVLFKIAAKNPYKLDKQGNNLLHLICARPELTVENLKTFIELSGMRVPSLINQANDNNDTPLRVLLATAIPDETEHRALLRYMIDMLGAHPLLKDEEIYVQFDFGELGVRMGWDYDRSRPLFEDEEEYVRLNFGGIDEEE